MALSNAERNRRFLAARRAEGLTTVTLLVPVECAADLQEMAELLRADRNLRPGNLRNDRTGVFYGMKKLRKMIAERMLAALTHGPAPVQQPAAGSLQQPAA